MFIVQKTIRIKEFNNANIQLSHIIYGFFRRISQIFLLGLNSAKLDFISASCGLANSRLARRLKFAAGSSIKA